LEYLKKNLNLPTYTVNSFNYKEDYTARLPVIQETLDISVTNYAHVTGKRIFINPMGFADRRSNFSEEKSRVRIFNSKRNIVETEV
jgi:hypothetical protein